MVWMACVASAWSRVVGVMRVNAMACALKCCPKDTPHERKAQLRGTFPAADKFPGREYNTNSDSGVSWHVP